MLQVVWFKRDLRIHDNEAFSRACAAGPVLCIYVFEPEYWALKDTSDRQWRFIRESLDDLSTQLRGIGGDVTVLEGTVTGALAGLSGPGCLNYAVSVMPGYLNPGRCRPACKSRLNS